MKLYERELQRRKCCHVINEMVRNAKCDPPYALICIYLYYQHIMWMVIYCEWNTS